MYFTAFIGLGIDKGQQAAEFIDAETKFTAPHDES